MPDIEPHTKAKHQIIEEYITNLIVTLYGTGKRGVTTFTFIDGFCAQMLNPVTKLYINGYKIPITAVLFQDY